MGQCQSTCGSLINSSQISQDEVQLKPTIEQNSQQDSIQIKQKEPYQSKSMKQTSLKPVSSPSQVSPVSSAHSPVNPFPPNQPSSGNQIPSSTNLSEKPKPSEGSQTKKVTNQKQAAYEGSEEGIRGMSKLSQKYIQGEVQEVKYRASINIFYGTTSGSSCDMAFQLSNALENEGFFTRIIDLRKFDSRMLFNSTIVAFILSSQGSQGGPTEDAQQFYYWLNNKCKLLPHLQFTVFGLFNSAVQRHPTTQGTNQLDTEQESTHNLDVTGNQTPNRNYSNYPPSPSSYVGRSNNNNNPGGNYNSPIGDHDPIQAAADFAESAASRLSISMNRKPVKIKSMGQRVDMVLEELQATRFFPLKHFDSVKPDLLKDYFRLFQESLLKKLKDSYPLLLVTEEQAQNSSLQFNIKLSKNPTTEEQILAKRREGEFKAEKKEKQSSHLSSSTIDYYSSPLVQINSITKMSKLVALDQINDNFLKVNLDLSGVSSSQRIESRMDSEGLIEVYVQNDKKSVETIQRVIGISPDSIITVAQKNSKKQLVMHPSIEGDCESETVENEDEGKRISIPYPISADRFLTDFLDIHSSIDVNEIFELSRFAQSPSDIQSLRTLCSYQEREQFQNIVVQRSQYHSLFSLITAFNIKVPLQVLIGLNRSQKPRSYLPTSFTLQDQANIIIKVPSAQSLMPSSSTKIEPAQELPTHGLVTSYFINLAENWKPQTMIRVHNQSSRNLSQFRSWKDFQGKIVLISSDEGFGVISAFLEEATNQRSSSFQEIVLFYSSPPLQKGETTYLFENDIKQYQENGIISKLYIQVEPLRSQSYKSSGQNQYPIQSFLESCQEEIQQLIQNITDPQDNRLRICVCGTQLMTQAVLTALAKAQAANSRTSKFAAFNTILNLENEGKILRIAWS